MSPLNDLFKFVSDQTRKPAEFLALLGVLLALLALVIGEHKTTETQILIAFGATMTTLGASMIVLNYLQQTRKRASGDRRLQGDLIRLRREIEQLKAQAVGGNFTPEERQKIVADVTAGLSKNTASKLAAVWAEEFERKAVNERYETLFGETADNLVDRLLEEISALGRRANVNLAIGILISAMGLIILTWFVFAATNEISIGIHAEDAALRFVVRLSLAIFIEVFAYFFLRLYRYSIFEIKYFQNEITGVQIKLLALISAMRANDNAMLGKLCLDLARTERNFVLKKGESTVALLREGIEQDYENRLFALVEKLVSNEKRTGKQ